jgi:hypothetical protein
MAWGAMDRWGTRVLVAVTIVLPVVACIGALLWPDSETVNGVGGLFGWGEGLSAWETLVVALLAARWAVGKAPRGVGQVICAVGAAMLVVALFMGLELLVAFVDPHDARVSGYNGELTCGFTDNDPGCHNLVYLIAFVGGLFAELFLVGLMVVGAVLYLLVAALWRRRSSLAAQRG